MEILNLYTTSNTLFQYHDPSVDVSLITTLYFRPYYITSNNYYEILLDSVTNLVVYNYGTEMTTEYNLYTEYDIKPFIDTYYTTIVDIVDERGELIEGGADILIPSPELTDFWGNYYDIEIGSNGTWSFYFYQENDESLYSKTIQIPSNIGPTDFYLNRYLDSRFANEYFANYWEQIYNEEFISIGNSDGYFEGLEKGKQIGYDEGFNVGYDIGYESGETNRPLTTFGTVIKVISDNASELLQTEILPNFTISNIIFIPVIFSLLGIVFKFFRR